MGERDLGELVIECDLWKRVWGGVVWEKKRRFFYFVFLLGGSSLLCFFWGRFFLSFIFKCLVYLVWG